MCKNPQYPIYRYKLVKFGNHAKYHLDTVVKFHFIDKRVAYVGQKPRKDE